MMSVTSVSQTLEQMFDSCCTLSFSGCQYNMWISWQHNVDLLLISFSAYLIKQYFIQPLKRWDVCFLQIFSVSLCTYWLWKSLYLTHSFSISMDMTMNWILICTCLDWSHRNSCYWLALSNWSVAIGRRETKISTAGNRPWSSGYLGSTSPMPFLCIYLICATIWRVAAFISSG